MSKFLWGDQAFTFSGLLVCQLVSACVTAFALFCTTPSGPAIDSGMSLDSVRGLVAVNVAYVWLHYNIIGAQLLIKLGGEAGSSATNIGQRSLGNMLETVLPVFLLLWLYCIYVDASTAAALGWVYLIGRAWYPLGYGWYGEFTNMCELGTQPAYNSTALLLYGLMGKLILDRDLVREYSSGGSAWLCPWMALLANVMFCFGTWLLPLGAAYSHVIVKNGNAYDQAASVQAAPSNIQTPVHTYGSLEVGNAKDSITKRTQDFLQNRTPGGLGDY